MEKNSTAKAIKIIGIIEIISGAFLFVVSLGDSIGAGLMWLVAGLISGVIFIGFSEIINLLQQSVDKQKEILSYLKDKPSEGNSAPKSVLQDIESNLPMI